MTKVFFRFVMIKKMCCHLIKDFYLLFRFLFSVFGKIAGRLNWGMSFRLLLWSLPNTAFTVYAAQTVNFAKKWHCDNGVWNLLCQVDPSNHSTDVSFSNKYHVTLRCLICQFRVFTKHYMDDCKIPFVTDFLRLMNENILSKIVIYFYC